MSAALLDVNLLIALSWPAHEFHQRAHKWFRRRAGQGWATCPFTQTAFVRLLSNPAFSPHAVTPIEALKVLGANLEVPGHHFWPDDLPLTEAVAEFSNRIVGHRQVTDAYLLGLCIRKRGRLATLDEKVMAILPTDHRWLEYIEILP